MLQAKVKKERKVKTYGLEGVTFAQAKSCLACATVSRVRENSSRVREEHD